MFQRAEPRIYAISLFVAYGCGKFAAETSPKGPNASRQMVQVPLFVESKDMLSLAESCMK